MDSLATIQFNYSEALRRAGELETIAGNLDRTKRDLSDTMQDIAANWKGESASQYGAKGGLLGGQLEGSARDLRNTAGEIRRIAKIIYDTEMRNLEIAAERDF